MSRPRVICHMVPSLDGRIVTKRWGLSDRVYAEYERTAATFDADAWMIGRVSMEPYAGRAPLPTRRATKPIPRRDFVARPDAGSFAVALDPSGKLRWRSASIDEDHVIAVLTSGVPDRYLAWLRELGVSYVFGGAQRVNLRRVLEKLRAAFGIETLVLEGGGTINCSFLAADLVDEVSVLLAPVADGSMDTPTLFDEKSGRAPARKLELRSVERRDAGLVWLRYDVKR